MKKNYLITVYANDKVGLLLRISQLFVKKNLNIERLILHESAVKGVMWINLMINTDCNTVKTVIKMLEKQIDVLQAFYVESVKTVVSRVAITEVS